MSVKRRLYEILAVAAPGDRLSRFVDISILLLIFANVVALAVESTWPDGEAPPEFVWFETFSVAVFTIELVARVWSCTEDPRFRAPVAGRLRFLLTPMALLDILAVAPYFLLAFVSGTDTVVLRTLRLVRVLRLGKLTRYSESLRTFARVFAEKRGDLAVSLFILALILVIASSLMHVLERDTQSAFDSIPKSMWWGVITLTTVGYGDVNPETPAGKVLGAFIAVLGIGMFALPAGILGSAFSEAIERQRGDSIDDGRRGEAARSDGVAPAVDGPATCPHCGQPLHEPDPS